MPTPLCRISNKNTKIQYRQPIHKYFCLVCYYLLALFKSLHRMYVCPSERYNLLDLHRTSLSEREVRPFRVGDSRRLFSPQLVIFETSSPLKLRIVACDFNMGRCMADILGSLFLIIAKIIYYNILSSVKQFMNIFFYTFTLYPAHSNVGRGNLVLRHFVPHLLPNSGGIACRVTELNTAHRPYIRAKK